MSFLLTIEQGAEPAARCGLAARDPAKAEALAARAGPEVACIRRLMGSKDYAGATAGREHVLTDAGALE